MAIRFHGTGKPIIEHIPWAFDTRTRVVDIAMEYEMLGHSPDEIVDSHSHLNLSQVHDALSFYYENRSELDRKIEKDQEFVRQLRKTVNS